MDVEQVKKKLKKRKQPDPIPEDTDYVSTGLTLIKVTTNHHGCGVRFIGEPLPPDSFDGEQWRPIPRTDGCRLISNFGRIWSVPRVVTRRNGAAQSVQGRYVKTCLHYGYPMIPVWIDGVCIRGLIHRLEWEAFNGPIPKGIEINHKDGSRTNNRLTNLELVTKSGNQIHALRTGLRKDGLDPVLVRAVRAAYAATKRRSNGVPTKGEVARLVTQFGLSHSTIKAIGTGHSWGWIV